MSEDLLKEIVIAAINNDLLREYSTNEETAKEIAKFINTLRKEIDNN